MSKSGIFTGIFLAVLATLIWSGNFIIARFVTGRIPPVSLSFYRWVTATIIILPFAWKAIRAEWPVTRRHIGFLFWPALSGIALFNTFVYVGAHYTNAINLALIGTTSSPVFSNILARIFLKEKIGWLKITGILICLAGILFLLSKGQWANLLQLQFSEGDLWVLLAALSFSVYNTLVRKKPPGISSLNFLFTTFLLGSLLLLPFYFWEKANTTPVHWNLSFAAFILYLGAGASVICFLLWNKAIHILGAGRTALFGNLIPLFSTVEAVIILKEPFTITHVYGMLLIFAGLLLANLTLFIKKQT